MTFQRILVSKADYGSFEISKGAINLNHVPRTCPYCLSTEISGSIKIHSKNRTPPRAMEVYVCQRHLELYEEKPKLMLASRLNPDQDAYDLILESFAGGFVLSVKTTEWAKKFQEKNPCKILREMPQGLKEVKEMESNIAKKQKLALKRICVTMVLFFITLPIFPLVFFTLSIAILNLIISGFYVSKGQKIDQKLNQIYFGKKVVDSQ